MDALHRHIAACNNATLPGKRMALRIGAAVVGWPLPDLAAALTGFPGVTRNADGSLVLTEPHALPAIARSLAQAGHFRWRDEAFDVRATPGGPVLAQIDRGALPRFGVMSVGVHVNGLVRGTGGVFLWVAHRSPHKALDPGKLDHLVAGGVAAGMTPWATLIKEAGEEASVPPDLAARAVAVGSIAYAMERAEGLRRDYLHCYDLDLPESFIPHPNDDEVERFTLWPLPRVLAEVASGDAFKFNVNLVLIDLFLRHDLITGAAASRLRHHLATPAAGAPA